MRPLPPSEQPDSPCSRRKPSFKLWHTRVRGWVEQGEGREVMFKDPWHELALREREMIWSCADSWDHNTRLPAAAWITENERESDTERLLQTANNSFNSFNYFKLGSRKQLRKGGKTTRVHVHQQSIKSKMSAVLHIQMFCAGRRDFKGAAASGDNVPELRQPSLQMTVSWLQLQKFRGWFGL